MAREGLMDDTGWHEMDRVYEFAEKYCERCKHNCEDLMGDTCSIHGMFICNGEDFEDYETD